jgi:hypothetical protein
MPDFLIALGALDKRRPAFGRSDADVARCYFENSQLQPAVGKWVVGCWQLHWMKVDIGTQGWTVLPELSLDLGDGRLY